ncbi:hypothetical protein DL96DRAFT_1707168 [Flagelloscypha sp. PMI_526]|nr:hypothetical protein DL96DRAFT_1707168 [Flagelloscypha sp. PMI_526]
MTATLPVEVVWLSTSRCSVIHRQSSFPATFFTPSRKGKERFYESFLPHHFAQNGRSQFPPWSTSNICGSQYDHHVTSGFMSKDWLSEPIRGPSRAVPCSPRLLGPAWRANSQRVQKRHSSYSYSSELNPSSRPRADEQTNLATIRALHHEKDTAGSKFNADKAHGAFLRVVQSRSLDSFSTKDLLLLAHKMIISAENLLYNPETNTRILRAEGH